MLRRDFLKTAIASSLAASTFVAGGALAAPKPKRILVLGGTLFLGPPFVEAARASGHTVTLFNRGITNPELFPDIEKLKGIRSVDANAQNLSQLGHRRWDVVVDVWPNDPLLAESAARRLADQTDHYIYVSSIGAYDGADWSRPNLKEDAPLAAWNSKQRAYNRGKAESERRLSAILGERLAVVRPGAIKGPRDDTPDLYLWLRRFLDRDVVLAPGDGTSPVQLVDVGDVADLMLLAAEHGLSGAFNAAGPEIPFRDFLAACRSATHSSAELVWLPQTFLENAEPADWQNSFPYYLGPSDTPNFYRVNSDKARGTGWESRPLRYTALETLAYFSALENFALHDPMSADQQDRLLAKWRKSST